MNIDDETTDVLIGGYLSAEAAHEDYEAVLACGARLWGAVVVTKDLEGNLAVEQTDHAVEEGAAGAAGVGFVVGLFAPPLLAATAIGAALGAVGGEALHKKLGSAVEKMADDTIPIGGAGLIVAYAHSAAEHGRTSRHPRRPEGGRRSRRPPRQGPQGRARRRPAEDGRRQRCKERRRPRASGSRHIAVAESVSSTVTIRRVRRHVPLDTSRALADRAGGSGLCFVVTPVMTRASEASAPSRLIS